MGLHIEHGVDFVVFSHGGEDKSLFAHSRFPPDQNHLSHNMALT